MRRFSLSVFLCSLLLCATSARAQTVSATDYVYAGTKMTAGGTTFGQVLRVVGLNSDIGAAGGGSNPTTVDTNGDIWKSPTTTVNTVDQWTWASKGSFTDALFVTSSTSYDAAVGTTGIYVYKNASTPRIKWETAGTGKSWIVDNDTSGIWRLIRVADTGTADEVPLQVSSNVILDPLGKFVLPNTPYTVSFGSIGAKFDAAWFSNLFIDTLVAFQTMATIDGRMLIGNGNIFDEDVSPSTTTITVRVNNISNGDFLMAEKNGRRESMKATSGATAMNKITDPSFEAGAAWDVSSGDSVAQSTAKAWDFNNSMLVTHGGSTLLQVAQPTARGTMSASTAYTTCVYLRRDDAAIPVAGDVQINTGSGTFVNMTIQDQKTDGWVRACASFTTPGSVSDGRYVYLNWTTTNSASSHDWYVDAAQSETGSKERPYSTSRSQYTVTRNLDSTVANQWYAGDSLFDLGGAVGYGWMDCYSISGLKSATEVGPTCAANIRTATTNWNDWATRAAWGQLNGLYDYASSTFGFAAGNPSGTWIAIDATNGLRIKNGSNLLTQWDTSGNGTMSGSLSMGVGGQIIMDQHGAIRTPGDSALNTGSGFWLSYFSGLAEFRLGQVGTQFIKWDGTNLTALMSSFTVNRLTIDSSGAKLTSDTSTFSYASTFGFTRAAGVTGDIAFGTSGWDNGTTGVLAIQNILSNTSKFTTTVIGAGNNGSLNAWLAFNAAGSGNGTMDVNGVATLTTTVGVPCGTLTFTMGLLTSKGACP